MYFEVSVSDFIVELCMNFMFSNAERNYISGKFIPSESYKRVLDNRIRKKLKEFSMLELPLLKSNVTEFSNNITEFSNNSNKETISQAKQSLGRAPTPRPNAYE